MKCPLQIVQRCTTSSEFVKWFKFLKMKHEQEMEPSKQDWYLARIAWEVHHAVRAFSKSKKKIPLKNFLLKFKSPKKKKKQIQSPEQQQISQELRTQMSKNFWLTALGMNDKDSQKPAQRRNLPPHVKQKSEVK